MGSANTYNSMKPNYKEKYGRLKKVMKGRKATAELQASKNPMKFAKNNIEPSLKGKKGIAL